MKRIFILSISFLSVFSIKAQTADEIINKHVEAMGGKELLANLQTMVREGAIAVQGMELPITLTQKHGFGFRMDISVMGTNGYQIYTDKAGWSYMPFQGNASVEQLSAEKVKDGLEDIDAQGLLFNYKDKGHSVELLGSEKVDAADCFKLKLTMSNGLVNTYFIDKTNWLVSKVNAIRATPQGEESTDVLYKNYKKVDGIMVAHSLIRKEGEVAFNKITINPKVEDGLFKPEN